METVFTGSSSHCVVSKPKMTFYKIALGLLLSLHLANHITAFPLPFSLNFAIVIDVSGMTG